MVVPGGVVVIGHVLDISGAASIDQVGHELGLTRLVLLFVFVGVLLRKRKERFPNLPVKLKDPCLVLEDAIALQVEQTHLVLGHRHELDVSQLGSSCHQHFFGLLVHKLHLSEKGCLVEVQNVHASKRLQVFKNYVFLVQGQLHAGGAVVYFYFSLLTKGVVQTNHHRAHDVLQPQADREVFNGL